MRIIAYAAVLGLLISCGEDDSSSKEKTGNEATQKDPKNIHEMNYGVEDTIKMQSIENQAQVKDGPFELLYPSGIIKAKGTLKNGEKQGLWESFFEDGTRWSSTYYNSGKPNGYSITYYKNGTVQYKGEYKNGERTGHWEFYLEDGTLDKSLDY
jgi:antitoxin component YwqK of YwqJK toxin-antitoxin module